MTENKTDEMQTEAVKDKTTNPMKHVESDITELMKTCFSLKEKAEQIEKKAYKDQERLLLKQIEIMDAFERVLGHIEAKLDDADKQTKIWIGNFRTIYKVLKRSLKDEGIVPIEAPARKAVPGFHTIEGTRIVDGVEDLTIVEELEKGYMWHNRPIRKARVIVAGGQNTI